MRLSPCPARTRVAALNMKVAPNWLREAFPPLDTVCVVEGVDSCGTPDSSWESMNL